jgi:hypothetical protein
VLPIFLPIHGKKLIHFQVNNILENFERIVSIPYGYELTTWEEQILKKNNFSVLEVITQTLEDSLIQVIRDLGLRDRDELDVLHGDSLVSTIPLNSVSTDDKPVSYEWGVVSGETFVETKVFSGRIYTNEVTNFLQSLIKHKSLTECIKDLIKNGYLVPNHAEIWKDFGNLGTYINSKKTLFEKRYFNQLEYRDKSIYKSSREHTEKIRMEAQWFNSAPIEFRRYLPKLTFVGDCEYATQFISAPSLHEVFVHGRLNEQYWDQVFRNLREYFLLTMNVHTPLPIGSTIGTLDALVIEKLDQRIEEFDDSLIGANDEYGKIALESLVEIRNDCLTIERNGNFFGFIHGDMVLSNILWDSREEVITLIDPKALNHDGSLLVLGDLRYDLGKLYQSMFLSYDFIIAGRFGDNSELPRILELSQSEYGFLKRIHESFVEILLNDLGILIEDVFRIALAHLASLVPLHSDRKDRQKLFIEAIKVASQRTVDLQK